MPSDGKLLRVFIASPEDVAIERNIAASVIEEWNDNNCDEQNIVLRPKIWKIHATPDLATDGQEVVIRQLVDNCDILIGIFWQRLGTPTRRAVSGTAEEIEHARNSGKQCLIYFSNVPFSPSTVDRDQFNRLYDYKTQLEKKGLIGIFEDQEDFRRKLFSNLRVAIQKIIIKEKPITSGSVSPNPEEASGQTTNHEQTNTEETSGETTDEEPRTKRRVQEVLERGSTRRIDLIVDSALYIAYSRYTYIDDLKTRIRADRPIPTKYLYCTDEGCRQWLQACENPRYKFYQNSVDNLELNIKNIIDKAVEVNGDPEFDFISLGSGNGVKDQIILKEMCKKLSQSKKIYYYPIDISDPMIVEAVRNSMKDSEVREKVDVKAIIGDITNLKPLEFIYEERPCKNFFSIIGNTIGNTDEKEIIDSINQAMFPGDLVLIEINLDQDSLQSGRTFYKDEISMRSHFVPLESLGVTFNREQMNYRVISREEDSVVPETMTLKVSYRLDLANTKDGGTRDVHLISVHHYKLECFIAAIQTRLNVEVIFQHEQGNVGLLLAQKKMSQVTII